MLDVMNAVALAFSSNERYFPGLYCAVATALAHMAPVRSVDLWVLDGGISEHSKNSLSRLIENCDRPVRLKVVPVDASVFQGSTLGPGQSYMAYVRILLPQLVSSAKLLYLDCDILVYRDIGELYDLALQPCNVLAAVPDAETLFLGDDSQPIADSMRFSGNEPYFNSGVLLMDLNRMRCENFVKKAFEFEARWAGQHRFHDQSIFNFLFQGRIESLPEHWNRPAWRFDEQPDNKLDCILHYTNAIPWLRRVPGPAQSLFEKFATDAGIQLDWKTPENKTFQRQAVVKNVLAPFRAMAHPAFSLMHGMLGHEEKAQAHGKAGHYWMNYICRTPQRSGLHRRRIKEIEQTQL